MPDITPAKPEDCLFDSSISKRALSLAENCRRIVVPRGYSSTPAQGSG